MPTGSRMAVSPRERFRDGRRGAGGRGDGKRTVLALMSALVRRGPSLSFSLSLSFSTHLALYSSVLIISLVSLPINALPARLCLRRVRSLL